MRVRHLALIGLLLSFLPSFADERILDYHSNIEVQQNGDLMITEIIKVRSEGRDIRRGIYRDFPTHYKDRFNNKVVVNFNVLDVQRDGRKEAWHTEKKSNGIRIYAGRKDHLLRPGEHVYRLQYRTGNQIGYFKEQDELYFNAIGTGWVFPIDQASAEVVLPAGIPDDEVETTGYTGRQGSSEQALMITPANAGRVYMEATRPLNAHEGLTVVVGWPKGHVTQPSLVSRISRLLSQNFSLLVACLGVLGSLLYYVLIWLMVGKDPEPGVIIPEFSPPKGVSPAAARFITKMQYDHDCCASALISMAVKGHIQITPVDDKFMLKPHMEEPQKPLSKGEEQLYRELLGDGLPIVLDDENHTVIGSALKELKQALKSEYQDVCFKTNSGWLVPGLLISTAASVAAYFMMTSPPSFLSMELWAIGLMVIINLTYYVLLRQPTSVGRKLMDQLEGFKLYLSVAEDENLDAMQGPEETPELFEAYLPYALALGVEQAWSERFASVLSAMKANPDNYSYHSRLYGLHHQDLTVSKFTSSLTSSIASSSTAPGSSSGGGGRGFSGGGGGGGGGGGW